MKACNRSDEELHQNPAIDILQQLFEELLTAWPLPKIKSFQRSKVSGNASWENGSEFDMLE